MGDTRHDLPIVSGPWKDIVDKLLDLQKQATLERSHYYVAGCITEAIQEIVYLRDMQHRTQTDTPPT